MAKLKSMKYVRQFGSIWELPEHKFKELLETGAKAKSYNLNDYGRMIIDRDDIIDWGHSDSNRSCRIIFKGRKQKRPEVELISILMAICQSHPSRRAVVK
jgi:hypothetical protein